MLSDRAPFSEGTPEDFNKEERMHSQRRKKADEILITSAKTRDRARGRALDL